MKKRSIPSGWQGTWSRGNRCAVRAAATGVRAAGIGAAKIVADKPPVL